MILFSHFQALNQIEIHQNGAIRLAPNLLRLFGSVPKSKIVTMSAFILHGTLYGRFSRLCQETSEMSGMPSGTSYSVRRNTRITNQLYITKILGTTCRNYRLDLNWRFFFSFYSAVCLHFSRRTSWSQCWRYYGQMCRLFGKSLCQSMCSLWQEMLWWLPWSTLWYPQTWNLQSQ